MTHKAPAPVADEMCVNRGGAGSHKQQAALFMPGCWPGGHQHCADLFFQNCTVRHDRNMWDDTACTRSARSTVALRFHSCTFTHDRHTRTRSRSRCSLRALRCASAAATRCRMACSRTHCISLRAALANSSAAPTAPNTNAKRCTGRVAGQGARGGTWLQYSSGVSKQCKTETGGAGRAQRAVQRSAVAPTKCVGCA